MPVLDAVSGHPELRAPEPLPTFRVQLLGGFFAELLPSGLTPERTVPVVTDRAGSVSVQDVARAHRQHEGDPPLLLLTSHDLSLPGCDSLFGFASVSDNVAIVSSHRLGRADAELTRPRLANVIAHERGHLAGLRHCTTRGCLMQPAQAVEDIDSRGAEPCGRCPRTTHRLMGTLIGLAALFLLVVTLDAGAEVIRVRKQPFHWRAAEGGAELLFKDKSLVTLRRYGASSPAQRGEQMTRSLNRLFLQVHPPALEVQPRGSDRALISAGGLPVVEVLPGESGEGSAVKVGERWVGEIQPLLRAKGLASESCPGCHLRRIGEIDHEMSTKGRMRR